MKMLVSTFPLVSFCHLISGPLCYVFVCILSFSLLSSLDALCSLEFRVQSLPTAGLTVTDACQSDLLLTATLKTNQIAQSWFAIPRTWHACVVWGTAIVREGDPGNKLMFPAFALMLCCHPPVPGRWASTNWAVSPGCQAHKSPKAVKPIPGCNSNSTWA